jgi:uncharacterized protein (TIGR00369 family)
MASKLVQQARRYEDEVRRRMKTSRVTQHFGFALVAAEPGRVVLRMDVRHRHKQIHGMVHGGVLAALADTTAAIASYTVIAPGRDVVTVEMKINFLEGVSGGRLTAEGRVLRAGRNFIVAECEIRNEPGTLVAKALLTFGYVRK